MTHLNDNITDDLIVFKNKTKIKNKKEKREGVSQFV